MYRIGERLGENIDPITGHICSVLKERFGVRMGAVFTNQTSVFFEAGQNQMIGFGYSGDHRSDRPQAVIGLTMDKDSELPIGPTVNPGNMLDAAHFKDTFEQIRPFLRENAMIVFDDGVYSKDNSEPVTDAGFDFLTRMTLKVSDTKAAKDPAADRMGWTVT